MNSVQLSKQLCVGLRHVQKLTRRSLDNGLSVIEHDTDRFTFTLVSNTTGKAYKYEQIVIPPHKPKRKVNNNLSLNPNDLPRVLDLNKPTQSEKIAIVRFCDTSKHPIGHIAKAYTFNGDSVIKHTSLQTKFKRWIKVFKAQGSGGLQDKRGGKDFKANLDLVEQAVLGSGTINDLSAFSFYCFLYAKTHNQPFNVRKPIADISESSFKRSARHLLKTKPLLKDYLHIGMDAFTYAEPSFGREWQYANEQWEIDATPLDIMCKVPHVDGIRNYTKQEPSEHYHLVRPQLIAIIDNKTGARVSAVFQSSNTYSNLRLLYKAFQKLEIPEVIKGDNGADYVSAHMQDVLEELGINYIRTGKARGDEKGKIERSFRTLQHSAEFESLPGFVGHNVNQRQHLENEASTKLEKLSGVQTNIKANFMWWWELENWVDNYLIHKDQDKYVQHPAVDVDLTAVYRTLGKKSSKRVSKEGVRHRSTHFLSLEMWEQVTIGDSVEVREHIDNSNILYLFKDGNFIGEIQDKQVLRDELGLSVEDIKANKKAYKQRVVKEVKQRTKQAQKSYKQHQDAMRDEFLDIEQAQVEVRKQTKDDTQETSGQDYADYMRKLKVI